MKDDKTPFLIGAVAVFALGAGVAYYFLGPKPAAPVETAAPAAAPAPVAAPAEPLPRLEDSDAWVRSKAAGLSVDARFADWLKGEDLIARFAAAVNMVASGKVPADSLSFLRPRKKYATRLAGGKRLVDPASGARYDAAADAFASIDARAAAELFRTARPLIEQAWRNLGEGKGDCLDAIVAAARELLTAPTPSEGAILKPSEKGVTWVYAEEALEKSSSAQKQLMRMGPRNQAKVQAKVRELVLALGVPEGRLR